MSIYGTFVVCCDARGCDAEDDCGIGDEDGAHVVASERGWLVQFNGHALCPRCRPDPDNDGLKSAQRSQDTIGESKDGR